VKLLRNYEQEPIICYLFFIMSGLSFILYWYFTCFNVQILCFIEMGDDVRGPYCETKPGGSCCPGRDDQCTVPILDSYCYCDMFCNFTASDCCPDFWRVCHGGGPEPITRKFYMYLFNDTNIRFEH
jgi:hypothetical protein